MKWNNLSISLRSAAVYTEGENASKTKKEKLSTSILKTHFCYNDSDAGKAWLVNL